MYEPTINAPGKLSTIRIILLLSSKWSAYYKRLHCIVYIMHVCESFVLPEQIFRKLPSFLKFEQANVNTKVNKNVAKIKVGRSLLYSQSASSRNATLLFVQIHTSHFLPYLCHYHHPLNCSHYCSYHHYYDYLCIRFSACCNAQLCIVTRGTYAP